MTDGEMILSLTQKVYLGLGRQEEIQVYLEELFSGDDEAYQNFRVLCQRCYLDGDKSDWEILKEAIKEWYGEPKVGGGHDAGKLRMDLLPFDVVDGVAEVFTYGEAKYPDINGKANWKHGLPASAHIAAALRHISAIMQGEMMDDESGLLHSCHAIARLMMYQHGVNNDIGEDDVSGGRIE
jgi:hypothetical protein